MQKYTLVEALDNAIIEDLNSFNQVYIVNEKPVTENSYFFEQEPLSLKEEIYENIISLVSRKETYKDIKVIGTKNKFVHIKSFNLRQCSLENSRFEYVAMTLSGYSNEYKNMYIFSSMVTFDNIDTTFDENCFFVNVQFTNGVMRECKFNGIICDCQFNYCDLDGANFENAKIEIGDNGEQATTEQFLNMFKQCTGQIVMPDGSLMDLSSL